MEGEWPVETGPNLLCATLPAELSPRFATSFQHQPGNTFLKYIHRCFAVLVGCLLLQSPSESLAQESTLDVGVRIQKSASFYFENGVSVRYSDGRLFTDKLFLGISIVSSRLGSALSSNAINQDTFLLSAAWYWRQSKSVRPFGQFNTGYFRADYEEEVFDVLPNTTLIISPEIGIGYETKSPLKLALSAGYNFTAGDGISGPGTLYPFFMQMTATWRVIK
jgi:hypothetical protein